MKVARFFFVAFLFDLFAFGQNPDNASPPQDPFHGIKIVSSRLDTSTSPQTVQLDFINDSRNNITAWAYCVYAEKVDDSDPRQSFCTLVDPTSVVVDNTVQGNLNPKYLFGDCPSCHFVHLGEHQVLSATFSVPVKSAEIQINLIAYSNGQVEVSGPEGSYNRQHLVVQREGRLKEALKLSDIGKSILADSTDQHPVVRMINELQSRSKNDPFLQSALGLFKKPEWRLGNDKEFIPADERAYLSKLVVEQEMRVAEFSKYQIKEEGQ